MKPVKSMTTEELTAIWEDALHLPIDEDIPEVVAEVLAKLVDREAIEQ